jgi:hypothetical protein
VASTALAESVRAVRGAEVDLSVPQTQDKRQCVRQPEELGELVEEDGSKPEGISKHLLNLAEQCGHCSERGGPWVHIPCNGQI